MASINISLRKEAYDFLNSLKGDDKSFSEIILEIKNKEIGKRTDGKLLIEFVKKAKKLNIDWDEKEKRIKEFREKFEEEISKRTKK